MGKVLFNISMSLDGFVAGPHDEVERIFAWYQSGDTEFHFPGPGLVFKVSRASADLLEEASRTIGAMVTGRRNFDLAHAWGGNPPLGVPHFVVTHHPAQEWVRPGSPFTFVTDGVESAISQAKRTAGEKDVAVSSPSILQQGLKAGLIDEIDIDLVPILLGEGVRLFERLGGEPIQLENTRVIETPHVTHLRYRVVK
jgi:dihydrofolate reductase